MKSNPHYKNCQSCGMPLRRDEKGGGTNADGSKSTIPLPRMNTSVLAVPRSTAMSRPPPNDPQSRISAAA